MATATATDTLTVTEVKQAMKVLRLGEWTEDLLDEIELDRRLKISLEQADRGEGRPIEEFEKELNQKFASGYFTKENARRRIEEKFNG